LVWVGLVWTTRQVPLGPSRTIQKSASAGVVNTPTAIAAANSFAFISFVPLCGELPVTQEARRSFVQDGTDQIDCAIVAPDWKQCSSRCAQDAAQSTRSSAGAGTFPPGNGFFLRAAEARSRRRPCMASSISSA